MSADLPGMNVESLPPAKADGGHAYDLSRTPPEKVDAIARALAVSLPLVDICRMFACSPHLVYRVRDSRPDLVASQKEKLQGLGVKFATVSEACLDSFTEDLINGKVQAREKSFAAKLFADVALPLMGQATARVEHISRNESVGPELVETLRRIAAEARTKRAQVEVIAAPPDSELGAKDAKGQ